MKSKKSSATSVLPVVLILSLAGCMHSSRTASLGASLGATPGSSVDSSAGGDASQKGMQTSASDPSKSSGPLDSCKSVAKSECFSVKGVGRSYMGLFTGLVIEPTTGKKASYAVAQTSAAVKVDREKCSLKNDCEGEFLLCEIEGSSSQNHENVCLEEIKGLKLRATGQ